MYGLLRFPVRKAPSDTLDYARAVLRLKVGRMFRPCLPGTRSRILPSSRHTTTWDIKVTSAERYLGLDGAHCQDGKEVGQPAGVSHRD